MRRFNALVAGIRTGYGIVWLQRRRLWNRMALSQSLKSLTKWRAYRCRINTMPQGNVSERYAREIL